VSYYKDSDMKDGDGRGIGVAKHKQELVHGSWKEKRSAMPPSCPSFPEELRRNI
jgi:hypothetical protein